VAEGNGLAKNRFDGITCRATGGVETPRRRIFVAIEVGKQCCARWEKRGIEGGEFAKKFY
jgi:hypothetical protein